VRLTRVAVQDAEGEEQHSGKKDEQDEGHDCAPSRRNSDLVGVSTAVGSCDAPLSARREAFAGPTWDDDPVVIAAEIQPVAEVRWPARTRRPMPQCDGLNRYASPHRSIDRLVLAAVPLRLGIAAASLERSGVDMTIGAAVLPVRQRIGRYRTNGMGSFGGRTDGAVVIREPR
jgi:hypothetical protein